MGRKIILVNGYSTNNHPLRHTWSGMKQRCGNPKNRDYPMYGGRGIRVCERWKDSFVNFITDMGEKPNSSYSIDRKDNNGDYEPNNCRWATYEMQSLNRRNSRTYCVDGIQLDKGGITNYLGVSRPHLDKLIKGGLNLSKPDTRYFTINDTTKKAVEWTTEFRLWPSFFGNKDQWKQVELELYIPTLTKTLSVSSNGYYIFSDLIENAYSIDAMDWLINISENGLGILDDIARDQEIARRWSPSK